MGTPYLVNNYTNIDDIDTPTSFIIVHYIKYVKPLI